MPECLVPGWWNCLGRIRRCGFARGGVSLGVGFWHFKRPSYHFQPALCPQLGVWDASSIPATTPLLQHHGCQSPGPGDPTNCFILCFLGLGAFYHSSRKGARTDEDVGRVKPNKSRVGGFLSPGCQAFNSKRKHGAAAWPRSNWKLVTHRKNSICPFWKCTTSHSELSSRKIVREASQTVNISRAKIVIKTAPNIWERKPQPKAWRTELNG